jgi:hypothetical protein
MTSRDHVPSTHDRFPVMNIRIIKPATLNHALALVLSSRMGYIFETAHRAFYLPSHYGLKLNLFKFFGYIMPCSPARCFIAHSRAAVFVMINASGGSLPCV